MNQEKKQLIDNIDLIMKYVPFNWNAILVRHDTYAPESIRFVHVLPDSPKEYYIDINRESRTEYKLKEFTKSKIYIYEESIKKELPICNDELSKSNARIEKIKTDMQCWIDRLEKTVMIIGLRKDHTGVGQKRS